MTRDLPVRLCVLLLVATLACVAAVERGAYSTGVRAEPRATARRVLPPNYCISCHPTDRVMRVMREKEDREGAEKLPGGFLDPDGMGAHAGSAPARK